MRMSWMALKRSLCHARALMGSVWVCSGGERSGVERSRHAHTHARRTDTRTDTHTRDARVCPGLHVLHIVHQHQVCAYTHQVIAQPSR